MDRAGLYTVHPNDVKPVPECCQCNDVIAEGAELCGYCKQPVCGMCEQEHDKECGLSERLEDVQEHEPDDGERVAWRVY